MNRTISRHIATGLLVLSLSIAGCRKKATQEPPIAPDQGTQESTIIEQTSTPVTPAPATSDPVVSNPVTTTPAAAKTIQVTIQTTKGDIVVELDAKAAPITVANFRRYVKEGFYEGTVFHRVIPGFMIQGGGYTADMAEKKTHSAINNEASNGLKNERGTIAMARTPLPDSATSQFYINHRDNKMLDYGTCPDGYGYTVFGKVIKGMEVVDAIAGGPTVMRDGEKSFPIQPVSIKKAVLVEQ